jgi:hypothetical protein
MNSYQIGKLLILSGLLMTVVGLLFVFQDRLPFFNYFGRLPGDIHVEREGFQFYFPLATSILISLLLSLILAFLNRR